MNHKDYVDEWFTTNKNSIGIQTAKVYESYLQGRIIPA
nr:hypothetical protein [Priestia flexa]